MQRLLTALSVFGSGWLLVVACSEDRTGSLFSDPDAGSIRGLPGNGASGGSASGGGGGSGGSAGVGGFAGSGGGAGGSSMLGGSGGQDAGGVTPACTSDADCDDQNACTTERCQDGACLDTGVAALGTACGSNTDNPCTAPDTCNGAGVCQPNDQPGTAGMPCGSNTDDACTHPDTCDAQGICQPNDSIAGTACGSATVNECTGADECDGNGQCTLNNAQTGTLCGDPTEDECAHHDVCGGGVCLANDEPNGSACPGGSCSAGQCVDGQPVGCPIDIATSVPFDTTWSSVGRPDLYGGGCDESATPDYALVFKAPQAGTFRFSVHALVDSTPYTGADQTDPISEPPDGDAVITVAADSCAGPNATQLGCNDDVSQGNLDSQLDLVLTDQQVITVYLNERTQTGGGTGTLSITLQP
jgi:hypothetical protein